MNLVNENATRLKSPAFVRLRYSTARIVGIAGTRAGTGYCPGGSHDAVRVPATPNLLNAASCCASLRTVALYFYLKPFRRHATVLTN